MLAKPGIVTKNLVEKMKRRALFDTQIHTEKMLMCMGEKKNQLHDRNVSLMGRSPVARRLVTLVFRYIKRDS